MKAQTVFLATVVVLFLYVISPLVLPMLMGGILAVLFHPWMLKIERRGFDPRIGSALLTLGITVVLLLPASLLIYLGAKSGLEQLQVLRAAGSHTDASEWSDQLLASPMVSHLLDFADRFMPVDRASLVDTSRDLLTSLGGKAADWLGQLFARLPGAMLDLLMIVVSVYFLLSDGPALLRFIRRNSVFDSRVTERLIEAVGGMCRSVVLASVLAGACQALVMIITCLAVGQRSPFLIGVMVFFASFVPVVGAAPITFGLALYWLAAISTGAGVTLVIVALLIGGIDNVVRAAVLRGSANLHPLLAFVAAFGGLQAFGFMGIFLGPIIASLFLTIVEVAGPAVSRVI